MKTELMNIPGKGICIVISEINPNDFVFGGETPIYGGGIFSNIMLIADEMRKGHKISAIKEIRAQTGWGLREAKEYCDKYMPINRDYINPGFSDGECADKFLHDHMPKDFLDSDDFKI